MGRNSVGVEANGELRILLVVTVIIGLLLMLSLLMCYACVLKRLCCGTPRERKCLLKERLTEIWRVAKYMISQQKK
ncbi:unnamed protein product [Leptidea sinapis]|uniref:Uncharacterized protein n=1 Tax=Leptidea sinapis TaxID=189913 RepID=A0A5E4R2H1_9NEOP|nr:unnamed protein product [Leptidea sinapis]